MCESCLKISISNFVDSENSQWSLLFSSLSLFFGVLESYDWFGNCSIFCVYLSVVVWTMCTRTWIVNERLIDRSVASVVIIVPLCQQLTSCIHFPWLDSKRQRENSSWSSLTDQQFQKNHRVILFPYSISCKRNIVSTLCISVTRSPPLTATKVEFTYS